LEDKPYYLAYEERYQKVFEAGAERWGHSPDDEALLSALEKWVNDNNLQGKKVIEFACGEGVCGLILSKLGCRCHGVDIAPSAVEKSKIALKDIPTANVSQLDMVHRKSGETFDAAWTLWASTCS
jgi:SAM-dependent methyltransferases related to tRNA (uracil-5-)-methyltransferase